MVADIALFNAKADNMRKLSQLLFFGFVLFSQLNTLIEIINNWWI